MSGRVSVRRLAVCLALVGAAVGLVVPVGGAAQARAESSAVTVTGTGRFSNLQVTVSQTRNLINQVVRVSWKGGAQTAPTVGSFNTNYLQIMQCWGDDPKGPKRENCLFGANAGDSRGGNWVTSRQVDYGSSLVDPNETYRTAPGSSRAAVVPFSSVTGVTTSEPQNQFLDPSTSNEVPFARTTADGTGTEFFEMQTAKESEGLGCGARLTGGKVRGCWLVIVPRDTLEVDGKPAGARLESSPLSESNWDQRLVVRLEFDPVGLACPIGTAERRLVGQESIVEAISRWQPVLCGKTGSIFGYSQINDDLARGQTLAEDPWLSFVSDPLAPERIVDDRELAYAPAAVSGIGIAFNIDRIPAFRAPPDVAKLAGTRVESLRLNARLVAKLLTQSYRLASLSTDKVKDNPAGLTKDPEFLALNPEFKPLDVRGLERITVPTGQTDAFKELWAWVGSDRAARSFLAGQADPWGMKVNPDYVGLSTRRSEFPISDLACRDLGNGGPPLCPTDFLAYAPDLLEAGRAAARGLTLSKSTYTAGATGYRADPAQLSGNRALLALVDTATAARFKLPMASLENGAGEYVAPTEEGLAAGLAGMVPSSIVKDVLTPNPDADEPKAYPLTHLTYAVTAPKRLVPVEATAYARFLRYIAGPGQVRGEAPGLLPAGYVPLTAALKKQALGVADEIAAAAATPTATPSAEPSDATDAGEVPTTEQPATDLPAEVPAIAPADTPAPDAGPSAAAALSAAPSSPAATGTTPVAAAVTPTTPVGPGRYGVAALLVLIAAVVGVRPLVLRPSRTGA